MTPSPPAACTRRRPTPCAPSRSPASVPILRAWPGADGALIDACAGIGIDGLVIEALGSGNVADGDGAAIARVLERGIPVVVATSVPQGSVSFDYGGAGGGATLGDLGAIPAGYLSPGQARIALATALATRTDPRLLF